MLYLNKFNKIDTENLSTLAALTIFMIPLDLNKKSWQWVLLCVLAFIWGSSFILMKKGLEVYSHDVVASLRVSISFLVLLPFVILHIKKIEKKYWIYLLASGFLGNGIPAFLFTKAQTEISSSISGMLNSLTPIFVFTVGILLFKAKIIRNQIIGVLIGLVGAIGLISANGIDLKNNQFSFLLYIVAATICYAFSVNIIKTYLKEINSTIITALAFFSIGPFTTAYLFTTDFFTISTTSPHAGIAIAYISILAILGTALAVILFNMLIKRTSTLFTASVTYLIPIVAIFWGLMDGETIQFMQFGWMVIIFIGIYFINKNSKAI